MTRYTAVLMPLESGAWRAYFPDLVRCGREADDRAAALDLATTAARDSLARLRNERAVPWPRSLDLIRADYRWAEERAIDWSKAVIVAVDL
jgi:predicted RNase H-like HicB family nuclease